MLIIVVMCLMDSIWCQGIKLEKNLRKFRVVPHKSVENFGFTEDCYSINTKRNKNAKLREYLTYIVSTKKKEFKSSRLSH